MKSTPSFFVFLLLTFAIEAALVAALFIESPVLNPCEAGDDISIRYLGNKMAGDGIKGRARNVWDLQLYDGRIYLGGGSTVENAGPIRIWAYDLAADKFVAEGRVFEEAIELYRVLDGELYIPASDPARGDLNKFYRWEDGEWQRYGGPPELAHIRDLAWHDGKLVGVGNARETIKESSAVVSLDQGHTFRAATDPTSLLRFDNWFNGLFEYQGILFAPSIRFTPPRDDASILTFDDDVNRFILNPAYTTADFLPITESKAYRSATMRLWLPVEYEGVLVYPAKTHCVNVKCYYGSYLRSYGMFVKLGLDEPPAEVEFPEPAAVGEDVLVRDDVLYALTNQRLESGEYTIHIYRSTDPVEPEAWHEVTQFTCVNKARSFEMADGEFYVGLGHEFGEPVEWSGELLQIGTIGD